MEIGKDAEKLRCTIKKRNNTQKQWRSMNNGTGRNQKQYGGE